MTRDWRSTLETSRWIKTIFIFYWEAAPDVQMHKVMWYSSWKAPAKGTFHVKAMHP